MSMEMKGTMYILGASGKIIETIENHWDLVAENPLGKRLPVATHPIYVEPSVKVFYELLNVNKRCFKNPTSITSSQFRLLIKDIEEKWPRSDTSKQMLEKHLRLTLSFWETDKEKAAVLHGFLRAMFLKNNGIKHLY